GKINSDRYFICHPGSALSAQWSVTVDSLNARSKNAECPPFPAAPASASGLVIQSSCRGNPPSGAVESDAASILVKRPMAADRKPRNVGALHFSLTVFFSGVAWKTGVGFFLWGTMVIQSCGDAPQVFGGDARPPARGDVMRTQKQSQTGAQGGLSRLI